jgi:hypothetical protein
VPTHTWIYSTLEILCLLNFDYQCLFYLTLLLQVAGQTVPKEVLEAETLSRQYAAPHVNFYDPALYSDMAAGDAIIGSTTAATSTSEHQEAVAQAARIDAFYTALALCHTVIPEKVAGGEVVLSASSPDDEALVLGAKVSTANTCTTATELLLLPSALQTRMILLASTACTSATASTAPAGEPTAIATSTTNAVACGYCTL